METAARRQLGQAAEHGVDKQRGPFASEHQLMGIDLTGEKACGRDVKTVSAVMVLTGSEQVVETPEMGPSGHPKALAAGEQPYRSNVEALMDP